jgi:hypothetical protein
MGRRCHQGNRESEEQLTEACRAAGVLTAIISNGPCLAGYARMKIDRCDESPLQEEWKAEIVSRGESAVGVATVDGQRLRNGFRSFDPALASVGIASSVGQNWGVGLEAVTAACQGSNSAGRALRVCTGLGRSATRFFGGSSPLHYSDFAAGDAVEAPRRALVFYSRVTEEVGRGIFVRHVVALQASFP